MAALGIIELCGYSTALLVINKMYQYCNIKVITIDFNKPAIADLDKIPLLAQVKFIGSIEDINYALEVGRETALNYNDEEMIITRSIANYHDGLIGLIKTTKLKK